jgi:hypothetical protein
MTDMVYDPKTKAHIKDALYEALYCKVNASYTKQVNALILKNSLLFQNKQMAFIHQGDVIRHTDFVPSTAPRRSLLNRLHESLESDYDALKDSRNHLNYQELPFVLGYINQVLNASNSFDDYLRLLPSALHTTLEKLKRECPCRTTELPQEFVDQMIKTNSSSIDLLKQRAMTNLLMV